VKRAERTHIISHVIAFALTVHAYAQGGGVVWCAKPLGAAVRDYIFIESDRIRAFASQLADGGTYLYFREVDAPIQRDCLLRAELPSRLVYADRNAAQLNAFIPVDNEGMSYIYTNSKDFQESMSIEDDFDISNGGAVEGRRQDRIKHLKQLARTMSPDIVLIEGDTGSLGDLSEFGEPPPLIIRLRDAGVLSNDVRRGINVLESVQAADPSQTVVINLLPLSAADTQAWGFPEHEAGLYADNAQKLQSDLDRFGVSTLTGRWRSRVEFLDALKQVSEKTLIFVGESGDNGASIRLPGTHEVLTSSDLAFLPSDGVALGLICDSQRALGSKSELSVIGPIYTDVSRRILQITLDHRPAATTSEYVAIGSDSLIGVIGEEIASGIAESRGGCPRICGGRYFWSAACRSTLAVCGCVRGRHWF
jgi:hypothetical protein